MTDTWATLALAVIGSGVLAALVQTVAARRKTGADAASVISTAAVDLVEPLRVEIERLTAVVAAQSVTIRDLRAEVQRLESQLAVMSAPVRGGLRSSDPPA